ncbi:MAG: nicotinate (nicotinamide) nucleotide adenylyltransferase [Opitutaceae bacterium]|jgi:nicotinate-nucleotide adenylyltransferase|nr:nicotinate (nicotinamide) nucleotide adenylyltransferase [Opitutaceae bacterium]
MKIGLMGGSFDPVHTGHLIAAKQTVKQHGLDRVIMIPAAQAPQKFPATTTAAHHRIAMLRAAIEGIADFEVSDFEVSQGGASYTIDTVHHFHDRFPHDQLFWIMGSDKVGSLDRWRSIEALAQLVDFIYLERPGYLSSPQPTTPSLKLHRCDGNCPDISSTQLRDRLRHGQPVEDLVPPPVVVYIGQNKLYQ